MIDLAEVRSKFPQLVAIAPFKSGGQKEVCRAEYQGRAVVLKLILPGADADERATRELEAVRQLASSYIPEVVDSGDCVLGGDKRLYIVERFIDGENYRTVLQREPVQSLKHVLQITRALLGAAADFERAGLVHRDIKPENLMIDKTGKMWVLDLGIVRNLRRTSLTPTGGFGIGTIGYAPPEQYRNVKPEIDSRADLFAIGIVIHESLSGSHFYWHGAGDVLAVINKMDRLDVPRLALAEDPSNDFADFVSTLCQRFASRRPRTATQAVNWFEPIFQRLHPSLS